MKTSFKAPIIFAALLCCAPAVGQNHAGKMDTDGVLSEGEIPNPRIDYDWEQRKAQRHGDQRLNNPYNDAAADQSRRVKEGNRDWREDERDRREYERDVDRENRRSWFGW
jgi:hypothetical protein